MTHFFNNKQVLMENVSFQDLTPKLCFCNIMKLKPLFTPFSIDVLASNSLVSCQKARDELGYSPRSIYESIKDAVRWFKEERII